ncbi:MAG: beta-lactamase [Gemmatimonadetes bacterium]|nr:beta-lactamase [Gemmatimonadota bacterium]
MAHSLSLLALGTSVTLLTNAPDSTLLERIRLEVATVPGAVVGVSYHDLGSSRRWSLNGDSVFHAASTMKVPVLIELFRQADRHELNLDQAILLVNQFGSIVDASPYSLDPAEDSDSLAYTRVGERVPIRWLADRMITESSNLATNALIALVGAAHADSSARMLGATRTRVLRGVEDIKAFDRGLINVTTPDDMAVLLVAIQERRAASAEACEAMLAILLRNSDNVMIPAGLPVGTRVAHKTGTITGVRHDAAIVYPAGGSPYVLTIYTRGIPRTEVAERLMASISRIVWEARGAQ